MKLGISGITFLAVLTLSLNVAADRLELDEPFDYTTTATITGAGSYPLSWVELFKNNETQGCVQATTDGMFMFPNIGAVEEDEFYVAQQLTWNFNTNGDVEGWREPIVGLGVDAVTGGLLKMSIHYASFPFLSRLFQGPENLYIPCNSLKVLEIRYRNYDPANTLSFTFFAQYDAPSTASANEVYTIMPQEAWNSDFKTLLLPLSGNLEGWTDGNICEYISLNFNQAADYYDQYFDIDYIRLREDVGYEFNYDGDLMGWSASQGMSGLSVADGALTGYSTGPVRGAFTDALILTGINTEDLLDANMNIFEIGFNELGPGVTGGLFEWTDDDGVFGVNQDIISYSTTYSHDLSLNPEWDNNGPVRLDLGYQFETTGPDNVISIDYMRFRTADSRGPSVVYGGVEEETSVEYWPLY